MKYMILDEDHNLIPTDDVHVWGRIFDDQAARTVAAEQVGDIFVSTVFLGVDHSFGDGPPLWFETMLFANGKDKSRDEETHRYTTWDEAAAGHAVLVKELRAESIR